MILPASFLHCYNDNIFKGEKNRQFLDNFLTKSAIVFLLELAETCSTLKMEMSRSWFDENSKREAWFLRAKLALFLSTSSLHLTAPEVDPALHCISFITDLHWIGAHNGAKTFLKFLLMILQFFLGNTQSMELILPFFCQPDRFTSLPRGRSSTALHFL